MMFLLIGVTQYLQCFQSNLCISSYVFSFFHFQGLPAVVIDSEKTRFWRSNCDRPSHFLSTIEAIYYFCLQLHNFMADLASEHPELIMAESDAQLLLRQFPPYDGQFDNLLFFFKHTYQRIKKLYKLWWCPVLLLSGGDSSYITRRGYNWSQLTVEQALCVCWHFQTRLQLYCF